MATTIGTHNVSVTTPSGITGFVLFAVVGTNPALTTITPATANLGTTVSVTLTGSNLTGATAVNVDGGGGIVVSGISSTATTVTATFAIGSNATAVGIHNVSVTTPNGTSGAVVFTVINPNPPTVTTITPNTGALNTASLAITLTGTNLTGATSVNVGGTGITVGAITATATTVNTTFAIDANSTTLGSHLVSVTTPNGTTGTVTFTVASTVIPTVTSIYPPSGLPNKTVPVTITGTNFSAATTGIVLSGAGVTPTAFTVVNPTTITATFKVASGAAIGPRTVTVTGAPGSSTTFFVGPWITSLTPNNGAPGGTPTIAIAGYQLSLTTNVTVNGNGITTTSPDFAVLDDSDITASFAIATGTSALGSHNIAVVTANGTSNVLTYTVVQPPTLTSVSPTSGTQGATSLAFTMTGTNLTGATALNFSASEITYGALAVNGGGTSLTTTLTISASATLGAGTVSVTTPSGTSGTRPFTVNPPVPTLTSISPTAAVRGSTVALTLTGTNLFGATAITVSGTGVTCSVLTSNSTTVNANCVITTSAGLTSRTVRVTTPGGTTPTIGAPTFTVQGATITSITPISGTHNTTVAVSVAGSNLSGATAITISGPGVTCTGIASTSTTVTGNCAITNGANRTSRNVLVTTPIGSTNSLTNAFTVN